MDIFKFIHLRTLNRNRPAPKPNAVCAVLLHTQCRCRTDESIDEDKSIYRPNWRGTTTVFQAKDNRYCQMNGGGGEGGQGRLMERGCGGGFALALS